MMEKKMIPPDGGWGWIIVIAYALNNVIMVPILQGFSLVLKDVFQNLNIPATDASIIISVNSAFGMAVGLLHGPLLRNFGYRKIALVGSTIFTFGITMTAFATNFTLFMITYGLMASFGVGLTMSSFSLAVNTYFDKNRGRAVGMAMTVTGLGPIFIPQLISYLLSSYGTQGTIVILGGLTLHSLVGTSLLQPVKWHGKWQTVQPENEESNSPNESEEKRSKQVADIENKVTIEREEGVKNKISSTNISNNEEKRDDSVCRRSMILSDEENSRDAEEQVLPYKWWNSGKSLETINLGSCEMIFDENVNFGHLVIENDHEPERKSSRDFDGESSGQENPLLVGDKSLMKAVLETSSVQEKVFDEKPNVSCWRETLRRIVRFLDFDLLSDPIYVNMMLGMSIALFAEINFAVLTPFILGDMEFCNEQIATIMSTLAGVDLVSRGLVPFIGEWLRLPARHACLISLFLSICCRTMLIFSRSFSSVILVSIGLGFAKGMRSVNMFLVIPNYIPTERLASATGIQMVANGFVLMILGPFLGLSRDKFGSYVPCLIVINSTTALTIIMWMTEMCVVSRKTKRMERKQQYEQVNVRE